MSSTASSGQQVDPYVFKNPDVDFNSLQLNQNLDEGNNEVNSTTSNNNIESNIKEESPIHDNDSSIFATPTTVVAATTSGDTLISSNVVSPKATPISKFENPSTTNIISSSMHPDETIQNITTMTPVKSNTKDILKQEIILPTDITDQASKGTESVDNSKVSAYARLDFENFIFYVQTLQVLLGRKSEHDQSHSVDVHLGDSKAISRRHAKIFYNFGTERFELSIQGRNGAFVDDTFVERGVTVPLTNKSKIQIGQIVFRFVLPGMNFQENTESPSKPINPSDAISLRSTLYLSSENSHKSGENTPNLTSQDFKPVGVKTTIEDDLDDEINDDNNDNKSSIDIDSNLLNLDHDSSNQLGSGLDSSAMKKNKEKKTPRPPKPPKKVYTIDEIPEEYRTKPACSYSNLIATCLRTHGTPKGMSLAEIYKSIRDIFPYYKYCPDGWQSSVRHNLSLNKAFRKVSKEGKGWLWGLDEEYCAEKEKAKKKQQEAAATKAAAAAAKIVQQQKQQMKLQQERLEQQKQLQFAQNAQQHLQQQNLNGVNSNLLPVLNKSLQLQSGQLQASSIPLQTNQAFLNSSSNIPLQTNSSGSTASPILKQQFNPLQPHDPSQIPKFNPPVQNINNQIPIFQTSNQSQSTLTASGAGQKVPSIQAQLAANRGISTSSTPIKSNTPTSSSSTTNNALNINTKKALSHLQQQLVTLSKDLRKLVDKPTISQILTQAIAMTIAQVTQAAKTKGITTDPLATLIDTNPDQLTKILTVALNAATYKVTNGRIKAPLSVGGSSSNGNSANNTRPGTPMSSNASVVPKPNNVSASSTNTQPVSNNSASFSGGVAQNNQPAQQRQIPLSTPSPVTQLAQSKPVNSFTTASPIQQNTLVRSSASNSSSLPQQTVKKPFIPLIQTNKTTTSETKPGDTASSSLSANLLHAQVKQEGEIVNVNSNPAAAEPQQKPQMSTPIEPITSSVSQSQDVTNEILQELKVEPQQSSSESKPIQAVEHEVKNEAATQPPILTEHQPKITSTSSSTSASGTPIEGISTTGSTSQQQPTTTDFNFDELDDPEFDKVLESLSKEPTPGLKDDDPSNNKGLDEEELNKLLGSSGFNNDEFTKNLEAGVEHSTNITSNKRSFDDVENSDASINDHKIIKTE